MITPAVLFTEFAGRHDELRELVAAYERAAREGTGSIVLVEGEAGIGKSRLLAELVAHAGRVRGEVMLARCERFGAPYAPFAESISQWRQRRHFFTNDAMREGMRAASDLSTTAIEASRDEERHRIAAIVRAIEVASERAKALAYVLDDLHWSDYATAAVLPSLARLAAKAPLVLVCAYRESDVSANDRLAMTIASLASIGATRIVLEPLSPAVVLRLVRDAAPSIDPRAANRLCVLAEGNPYAAEELSRSMMRATQGVGSAVDIPLSLRAAIMSRLEGLSPEVRAVLESASVFANDIDLARLAFLCEMPGPAVLHALEAACAAQLLVPTENAVDVFRFRHAIGREVVYRSLIQPHALALHSRLADRLEATGADLADIAYQRWSARDAVRALAACEAAGDRATSLAAIADAATEYERALGFVRNDLGALERVGAKTVRALYLCSRTDDASRECSKIAVELERGGRTERASQMRILAVNATHWAGRPADAEAMLDAIGSRERQSDDPVLTAEILLQRARIAASNANVDGLRAILRDRAPNLVLTEQQRLRFMLFDGLLAYLQSDFEEMARSSRVAAERGEALGAKDQLIIAYSNVAVALEHQGKLRESLPYFDRGLALCKEVGDVRRFETARSNRAAMALETGDLETARGLLSDGRSATLSGAAQCLEAEAFYARVTGSDPAQSIEHLLRLAAIGQVILFGAASAHLAWCFDIADPRQRTFFAPLLERANVTPSLGVAYLYAAASLGNDEEAAAAARAAAAFDDDAPRPRALRQLITARMALRNGTSDREAASVAAGMFGEMGYVLLEAHALDLAGQRERAIELLRRAGFTAEADRIAKNGGVAVANDLSIEASPLSAREREIARLAGNGLSNREIGAKLGINPRTVETHVQNVFKKLGINSRGQLAAYVRAI